jgi:uncharacterized membrane protein YfcA
VTVEPLLLVVMLTSLFIGGFVNGLIGIGFALFAVNFLAAALGVREGVIVMSILAPFPAGYQLWRTRAEWRTWTRLRTLLAGGVAGSVFGAWLLVVLPAWAIQLGLGVFTGQFVVDQWRRSGPPISKGTERWMAPIAGFFSGMTNGALGASGPVAGSFILAIGLTGREFIFGVSLVFVFQALVRIGIFALQAQYTTALVLLSLALLVPTMVGQAVGLKLYGRMNATLFRRLLLAVLLVSAVSLLVRGGQGAIGFLFPQA